MDVEEPEMMQFLIVQERESLLNWMVEVPVVDDVLVLVINRESPPIFLPSTSTLSAPLKSIRGFPAIAPLTTRVNPPAGLIEMCIRDRGSSHIALPFTESLIDIRRQFRSVLQPDYESYYRYPTD